MSKVRAMLPLADLWRPLLTILVLLILATGLLVFRLGSIPPGLSDPEIAQRTVSSSVKAVSDNPLHLHQKLGLLALQKVGQDTAGPLRLASSAVAIAVAASMYVLLKFWYTQRIAILGTLLLVSSSWFLHMARLATPDINFMLPFVFAIGGVWLVKKRLTLVTGTFLALLAATLLYVPGMIWLFVAALLWQRRTIKRLIERMPITWQTIFALILIICLAPLIWALGRDPGLIIAWAGLPETLPSIGSYFRNISEIPVRLFIRSYANPVYGLGGLPLLDAFTGAMMLLGIFASFFRLGLDRTRLVIGSSLIGCVLIGFGGPVSIAFLLPPVYILAASGVALLLQQWLTVFPRNPFARWVGILLVTTTVLLTSYYHFNRYFIAWAKSPETKAVFQRL